MNDVEAWDDKDGVLVSSMVVTRIQLLFCRIFLSIHICLRPKVPECVIASALKFALREFEHVAEEKECWIVTAESVGSVGNYP